MYPLCFPFLIYSHSLSLTTLTYSIRVGSTGVHEVGWKKAGWLFLCHNLLRYFCDYDDGTLSFSFPSSFNMVVINNWLQKINDYKSDVKHYKSACSGFLPLFLCIPLISAGWFLSSINTAPLPPLPCFHLHSPSVSQRLSAVVSSLFFTVSAGAETSHEHQALAGWELWVCEERGGSGDSPYEELPLAHHVHLFLSCVAHQYCSSGFLCLGKLLKAGNVGFLFYFN